MKNELPSGSLLHAGSYRIVRALGQGGFGITYEAEQIALGRTVAVKEFFMKDCCERDAETSVVSVPTQSNRALVEKFKGKFIREARMIAALDHPNIVRVIDVFEENGTAYYVMENLPGGSLADKVKSLGALSEESALRYIRQVASALSYIHERNLVHLDVKPSNILLNAKGDAVLIDFGISKHYDESGSQTSSTPVGISKGYAPLEQSRDGDVSQFTPATDIYSLGATLYNLVTCQVPPEASIVNEDGLSRPSGISDMVWAAIERSMQPRRKDRPQSIGEFLSLLPAAESSPASASKPSTPPAPEDPQPTPVSSVSPVVPPVNVTPSVKAVEEVASSEETVVSPQQLLSSSPTRVDIQAPDEDFAGKCVLGIGFCCLSFALLFLWLIFSVVDEPYRWISLGLFILSTIVFRYGRSRRISVSSKTITVLLKIGLVISAVGVICSLIICLIPFVDLIVLFY